ncbi:MAG: hypothetical protein P0120_05915 [Nitrospira sp.]|nr:hypothetical protein [Nitrospira sp.]MDF0673863.1 hypothetical protein [Nitrospira sp.]
MRWSGRKPLLPENFFEGSLVPEFTPQAFDESLTTEQHLSLNMFPGRTMADPLFPFEGLELRYLQILADPACQMIGNFSVARDR